MTVCIAALADKGKTISYATDQMVTVSIPIKCEYENEDFEKRRHLSDNAVALIAGNALFADEIVEGALKRVQESSPDSFEAIAGILREEYQNFRREKVIQEFLEPRGFNLDSYYKNQNTLHQATIQQIEKALKDGNIDVEMVLIGSNGEEAHIYTLRHPGVLTLHDALGYACIGSGGPHAMYYLIDTYRKGKDLSTVEKWVKEAKKKAEKAPGVGRATCEGSIPEKSALATKKEELAQRAEESKKALEEKKSTATIAS